MKHQILMFAFADAITKSNLIKHSIVHLIQCDDEGTDGIIRIQ